MATPASLLKLIEDGVIDRVLLPMKSGKEADLFVVEKDGLAYAAKVYKPREQRAFKNNAAYRDGRSVRNTRSARAMDKGTKFGKQQAEETWQKAEAEALRKLHAAGVRVPQVYAHYEGVLVMELIADAEGKPAPQLAQVQLTAAAAETMYEQLVGQVILMLLADLVHGDFSPYNVLVGAAGPVVIDLPQVVSASHNQKANVLIERDVQSVARYLGIFSPLVQKLGNEAWQIWHEYERGALVPEFRPTVPVMAAPDPYFVKAKPVDTREVLDLVREAKREQEKPWLRDRGLRPKPKRDDERAPDRAPERGPRPAQQPTDRAPDRAPRPPRHDDRAPDRGPRPPRHDDRAPQRAAERGPANGGEARPHFGGSRGPQHGDRGDRGRSQQHPGDRGPRPQHGDRGRPQQHQHPHAGDRGPDRGSRPPQQNAGGQPRPAQGGDRQGQEGGGGRRRRRRRRGGPRPDGSGSPPPPAGV